MLRKLTRTSADDTGLLLIRLALGIVMLPHGLQKVFGWFGGGGIEGTLGFFSSLGVPVVFGMLGILAESVGALGLLTGTLTRVAALGILANQVGAVLLLHGKVGFFMNWSGRQQGEGYEFAILAIGMALALVVGGGGRASIDARLAARR